MLSFIIIISYHNYVNNYISYLRTTYFSVLSSGAHGGGHSSANASIAEEKLKHCGSNFCVVGGSHGNGNLERPPDSEIYLISTMYLCCIFVAVAMVALLIDPLSR